MTDKGYYDPARANGHAGHDSGAANGHDTGNPLIMLDSTPLPSAEVLEEEPTAGDPETEADLHEEPAVEDSGDGEAPVPAEDADAEVEMEETPEAAVPLFTDEDRLRHLRMGEALLFASAEPLRKEQIADRLPDGADVDQLLDDLAAHYEGRGVNLVKVAGGWAFRTATDLSFLMERERVEQRKLSRAALETLAIIAYHQPVTRAEIEDVRGVSVSKGTIDVLMEVGWVRIRGRRQTPGRPVTYGTSDAFLEHFGLDRIGDLPGIDELKAAGLLDSRMPTNISIPRPSDEDDETGVEDDEQEEDEFAEVDDDTGHEPAAAFDDSEPEMDGAAEDEYGDADGDESELELADAGDRNEDDPDTKLAGEADESLMADETKEVADGEECLADDDPGLEEAEPAEYSETGEAEDSEEWDAGSDLDEDDGHLESRGT